MKQHLYCFLILFLSLSWYSVSGQTVKGEVLDGDTGELLIGANVILKNNPSKGTVTDFDGYFELKVDQLPAVLLVSYIGFDEKEVIVDSADEAIKIELGNSPNIIDVDVVVKGQRISEKQKAAPNTVETMDLLAIKATPADNFYDGLGTMKGVDLTAASLGFKVINTRGFNSTSPVRSLQIIDGLDNQAPGLNFSLGNFLGSSELDVLKVDIIQGASSSFYGPNAFNGVISMETKNPFYTEGLSAQIKIGERNLINPELRWADSFKNKDGKKFIAYKVNLSHLRADDWEAENDVAVDGTNTPTGNPGGWDAVNVYGDEYDLAGDFRTNTSSSFNDEAGLLVLHREGYNEIDLVDYGTRNYKAAATIHIRTNPNKEELSPELILGASYGAGTTVYQGDNRFSLKNISFIQPKIEFRKKDDYFIRAYMSQGDSGDSYDPYFTALRLQERSQSNGSYFNRIKKWWGDNRIAEQMVENGYPEVFIDPITFEVSFDQEAADQWLIDNQDFLNQQHQLAREYASTPQEGDNFTGRLEPGTLEYERAFEEIITRYNNEEGGTRFYDRSALYHIHGEKRFQTDFAEIITGANGRLYRPDSRGTIFYDTAGTSITNSEFGVYAGFNKVIDDGTWRLSATFRTDKNENFDFIFTPAASVVWKPRANHYARISFASGVRNPTLSDQYLFLDVGPATLAGNLNGRDSLVTLESFNEYRSNFLQRNLLDYYSIDPIKPEKVNTIEAGYRATLFNNLYIDAGYYYSIYTDFIGFNLGLDVEFSGPTASTPENVDVFRFASNAEETVTTQGFSVGLNYYFAQYYQINGNYSYNTLITNTDDPIIPAFNTPEHKYNIGISGRNIQVGKFKNFGFNFNYKWIEGFLFEGSPQFTGFVPTYDLLDGQINYAFPKINTTVKIGATNILNNKAFQTYGGPRIGRLAYISLLYEWDKK